MQIIYYSIFIITMFWWFPSMLCELLPALMHLTLLMLQVRVIQIHCTIVELYSFHLKFGILVWSRQWPGWSRCHFLKSLEPDFFLTTMVTWPSDYWSSLFSHSWKISLHQKNRKNWPIWSNFWVIKLVTQNQCI